MREEAAAKGTAGQAVKKSNEKKTSGVLVCVVWTCIVNQSFMAEVLVAEM